MNSPLSDVAEKIAKSRYYLKDNDGNIIEDWEKLSHRVTNYVCRDESEEFKQEVFDLIYNTKFLPNTPCLVNAGKHHKSAGLSACFVTKDPEDSWQEIIDNVKRFGDVARVGGGCGVSFSKIRPEGSPVFGSAHAKACGPIEAMRMVSEAMSSITQSGIRGMANMSVLHCWHPDVFNFIKCKQRHRALKTMLKEDIFGHFEQIKNNTQDHLNIVLDKFISNFNISVMVTNKFMQAVKTDGDWNLEFDGKVHQTIKARDLFNLIAENAWKNGDPGMLFDDAINNGPYKYSGQKITATNPCAEQVLPEFGVCNLGSIDISKLYEKTTNDLNWKEFKRIIKVAIQFLDDVVANNKFPSKEFEIWGMNNRPVGLGIMGLADLFLKMKVAYGSKQSLELAEKIAAFLEKHSHEKSVELGKERGTPKCCAYDELGHRRNVTVTSIAPTGSISLLAGCSSSIEPVFAPTIYRYDNTGSHVLAHPDSKKSYFRCALDKEQNGEREVKWQEHIAMQAAFQKYGSSAISKTINMPNTATLEDVKSAYMAAWENGCFPKDTVVYTADGLKYIQEINPYDSVIAHDGISHSVKEVFHLGGQRRKFVAIKPYGILGIKCTIEHPILTLRPSSDGFRNKYKYAGWEQNGTIGYVEAGEIKTDDYVLVPKLINSNKKIKSIKISDYISCAFKVDDGVISLARTLPWKTDRLVKSAHSKSCPNEIIIDSDFCEFLGWFIAEGHFAQKSCIRLNFNINEQNVVDKLQKTVKRVFGLDSYTYISTGGGGSSLRLEFHSRIVSLLLQSLCGRKARNKHLPNFYTKIGSDLLAQIVDSYYAGDAGVTVSKQLSHELALSCLLLDRIPISGVNSQLEYSVKYRNEFAGNLGRPIKWNGHNYLMYKIQKIDQYESDEPVYNLSVDNADSYLVNGVAVHNCKGITVYRDGCKTTQVLNTSQKADVGFNQVEERPEELPCDIFATTAEGFEWHLIVGKLENRPYEIFAVNGRVDLPNSGRVIKRKKRHYSLVDDKGDILIDNLAEEETSIHPRVSVETRRFSLELRHGIAPKHIVEQIDKSSDVISSFTKAAGRVLKKNYLSEEDVRSIARDIMCPECAKAGTETEMISDSGCWKCPSCHWAKCG